jgi:DNA-binding GntR family transcriptional regulator
VLRRLALTKDMVRKALPRLAAAAMIERHGERHEIVDPLFAAWIARGADPPD